METNFSNQEHAASTNSPTPTCFTVNEVLDAFLNNLNKPNNYIRKIRRYLRFCFDNNYPISSISAVLYTTGHLRSRATPIRTFVLFAHENGIDQIQSDLLTPQLIIPHSKYISDFIQDDTAEDKNRFYTNRLYTKGLQKFFIYVDCQGFSYTRTMVSHFILYTWSNVKYIGTAKTYLLAIKHFTHWLLKNHEKLNIPISSQQRNELWEIVNYAHKLPVPAHDRTIQSFSKEQVTRLLDICLDERDRAVLALLAISGLTTSEVAALTWNDVYIEKVSIIIRSKNSFITNAVKLFGEALEAFTVYINAMQEATTLGTSPVFEGLNTSNKIQRRADKYLLKAGWKKKGEPPPSLRLTAGLLMLERGCEYFTMLTQLRYSPTESKTFHPYLILDEKHYLGV